MPESVAEGPDEVKTAWALGVFSAAVDGDEFEVKSILVEDTKKTYEKLEMHERSPQLYAVFSGSVAVPTALDLEGGAVRFSKVSQGEAIIVSANVWHGAAVGIDVPAKVMVLLKKGTTEFDTRKLPVAPAVRFDPEHKGGCGCDVS